MRPLLPTESLARGASPAHLPSHTLATAANNETASLLLTSSSSAADPLPTPGWSSSTLKEMFSSSAHPAPKYASNLHASAGTQCSSAARNAPVACCILAGSALPSLAASKTSSGHTEWEVTWATSSEQLWNSASSKHLFLDDRHLLDTLSTSVGDAMRTADGNFKDSPLRRDAKAPLADGAWSACCALYSKVATCSCRSSKCFIKNSSLSSMPPSTT
mmetsp:Transcript_46771/g.111238  ORF Transcript_46771/g.111238 Transcript_46771/m.111238 type:complete len:217 (+) Transcript_46771:314-964(+)